MDAVRLQYNGGPGYDSRYIADYRGILISDDPVAADRVGLELIEHHRKLNQLPTLEKSGRPVRYLKTAESMGLGTADLSKIEIVSFAVDASGQAVKAGVSLMERRFFLRCVGCGAVGDRCLALGFTFGVEPGFE